jgi:hypothetical protein
MQVVFSAWLRTVQRVAVLVCLATLGACASVSPGVYDGEKPELKLEQYFNGTVDAWGMFQDRSGKVVKRFTVVMQCTWIGDTGTLDEDFSYSDGTREKRIWTIKKIGPGQYQGTASDVVGLALGVAGGNALNWSYTLALPVNGKVYEVQLDDWMYQLTEKVLLNRAVMSKFGIRLGEITLSFQKR